MSFRGIYDVVETTYSADPAGGEVPVLTLAIRSPGETEGIESRDVVMYSDYGLTSRPPKPADNRVTQVAVVDEGGTSIAVGARDLRGDQTHGNLKDGDVALWSVGRNVVKLQADGGVSIYKQGASGSADAFITITASGDILIGSSNGGIQITGDGVSIYASGGECLKLGGGEASLIAPRTSLAGGSVSLGAGAAVPLALIPTVPVTGTAVPAFAISKPIPNIFV